MRKYLLPLAALLGLLFPAAAGANLANGTVAPAFATKAAIGGKETAFNLRAALRKGPVVLYFFPKAFTQGCTLETRAFVENHARFARAGATVIGMSADDIDTLKRFSTEECRSKFAVAMATPQIIRAYDVELKREGLPAGVSDRTSYVIAPDGKIMFVHSDLDYRDHVRLTLQAVEHLKAKHSKAK